MTCLGQRDRAYWILSRAALLRVRQRPKASQKEQTAIAKLQPAVVEHVAATNRQSCAVCGFLGLRRIGPVISAKMRKIIYIQKGSD